jgi:hypothetical protein
MLPSIRLLAWTLALATAACGGSSADEGGALSIDSDGAPLSASCSFARGSVDGRSLEGLFALEGDYARTGVTLRDEMRTLSIHADESRDEAVDAEAGYTRTVARRCTPLGCTAESGTMQIAFGGPESPVRLLFSPRSSDDDARSETYLLLGTERTDGDVTELCVARVAGGDVSRPFVMDRVR